MGCGIVFGCSDSMMFAPPSHTLSRYRSTIRRFVGRIYRLIANMRANRARIWSRYLVAETCQPVSQGQKIYCVEQRSEDIPIVHQAIQCWRLCMASSNWYSELRTRKSWIYVPPSQIIGLRLTKPIDVADCHPSWAVLIECFLDLLQVWHVHVVQRPVVRLCTTCEISWPVDRGQFIHEMAT